jgi:hypothetical protein
MKKIPISCWLTLFVLFTFLFNACSTSPQVQNITGMPDNYIFQNWDEILSPDGTMIANTNQQIKIEDRTGKVIFQGTEPPGSYYDLVSWFPDSKGFVLYTADHGCEKCPFDRLVVYQIDKQNKKLKSFTLEPLSARNESFWQDISWSPDGSEFAVIVNLREVDILDRDARVVRKLQINLDEDQGIRQGVWTKYGFLYIYDTYTANVTFEQLGIIDVNTQKQTTLMNDAVGEYKSIISVDPYTPRIIIVIDQGINQNVDIYNLETKKVEQTLYPIYGCPSLVEADPSPYVGILTCDNKFRLFYWKTRSITDTNLKNINQIEWGPDLGEFILTGGNGNDQWVESVKP